MNPKYELRIVNSSTQDIETIFTFYDYAIAHQKKVSEKHWLGFERNMIESEIEQNRQWKIVSDGQVVCVFATTFHDPEIWGEKDAQPAIYLHRISTHPDYRGQFWVKHIAEWAKVYGKRMGKEFVRLDTWGDNPKLIAYYEACGFTFLGTMQVSEAGELPKHYNSTVLGLFEMAI